MRHPSPSVAEEVLARPTAFAVRDHGVVVAQVMPAWRWTVSVDGSLLDGTFQTQAEAWEAGVREAERLDQARAP